MKDSWQRNVCRVYVFQVTKNRDKLWKTAFKKPQLQSILIFFNIFFFIQAFLQFFKKWFLRALDLVASSHTAPFKRNATNGPLPGMPSEKSKNKFLTAHAQRNKTREKRNYNFNLPPSMRMHTPIRPQSSQVEKHIRRLSRLKQR